MQYHLLLMVLAEYSSSYSLFTCHMMLATYDAGNIYFDLAETQQHFQTIVQLAHARPTMSCIHLVVTIFNTQGFCETSRGFCSHQVQH